jgi:predicted RNA-binding Zn-ribbon protein involved in translation (DUF1610 family)
LTDDYTVIECSSCGRNHVYTQAQMKEISKPWYCENCESEMIKSQQYSREELPQRLLARVKE